MIPGELLSIVATKPNPARLFTSAGPGPWPGGGNIESYSAASHLADLQEDD